MAQPQTSSDGQKNVVIVEPMAYFTTDPIQAVLAEERGFTPINCDPPVGQSKVLKLTDGMTPFKWVNPRRFVTQELICQYNEKQRKLGKEEFI